MGILLGYVRPGNHVKTKVNNHVILNTENYFFKFKKSKYDFLSP